MPKVSQNTKQKSEDLTDEGQYNLVKFLEVLIEIDQEEKSRRAQLKDSPKSFAMVGEGRDCSLCHQMVWDKTEGWYDKWGFKCIKCQDAINKKKIPGSLCNDWKNERCITDIELSYKSRLHLQTIRKLIRRGDIVARRIPGGPFIVLQTPRSL